MSLSPFDLRAHRLGLVVAPAGCGKTQTIVETLKAGVDGVTLILTHTNAGVSALRERLKKAGVTSACYRLATIDGWSLRLVGNFPALSGMRVAGLTKMDYPGLRKAAVKALASGALTLALKATYERLIVDEYQDCCHDQHALVLALAAHLPCCVLGDPLQRIFDFRPGALPDWERRVAVDIPVVQTFSEPWRWTNAGQRDFGLWILSTRNDLLAGRALDLRTAPANVTWLARPPDAADLVEAHRKAVSGLRAKPGEGLLVIGDSKRRESRAEFARNNAGLHVVEPVDMPDMIGSAEAIDQGRGVERLRATLLFAQSVMTGVELPALGKRLTSLQQGTARNPATLPEAACLTFAGDDSFANAAGILKAFADGSSHRVFRRPMLNVMLEALSRSATRGIPLTEAAAHVREQHRVVAKPMPGRAIGSTLLLKGLEAEHAIILDADAMNASHLYVAISRASTSLTIFSSSNVVQPARR